MYNKISLQQTAKDEIAKLFHTKTNTDKEDFLEERQKRLESEANANLLKAQRDGYKDVAAAHKKGKQFAE